MRPPFIHTVITSWVPTTVPGRGIALYLYEVITITGKSASNRRLTGVVLIFKHWDEQHGSQARGWVSPPSVSVPPPNHARTSWTVFLSI